MLPPGPPSARFTPRSISPLDDGERPQIAQVRIVDLDRDGLPDILACDALRNQVLWFNQNSDGEYAERPIGAEVAAPVAVEPVDFDSDGDLDLLVASLGVLLPTNRRIGSVVLLDNDGQQRFSNQVLVQDVARVADARAADLDADGDLDVAVAGFGYDNGETSWLENLGDGTFERHELLRLSGAINAIVADLDGDDRNDIVSLVSQEWEEIWAFVATPGTPGAFSLRSLWGSSNPDFGSSWISLVDLDLDEDPDILYSNGDAFDYAPANSRPWHGVQWLENAGDLEFRYHRIADLSGASSPQAADIDGDGDLDVVVSSGYNDWRDPEVTSLAWLENNGRLQFAMHHIASVPTHIITVAVGDLDGDGRPDLVTGGMHVNGPFDRMSRVTVWTNDGPPPQE